MNIIKNETYAGVRHVGKKGKGEIISQTVPAIIPRETWEKAQRLVRSNQSNAPRNAKREYLLRGLLFCGVCNRRYVGYVTNSAHNAYYKCGGQGCANKAIPVELAEAVIWEDISRFVSNPGPVLEQLQQKMAQLKGDDGKQALSEVESGLARLAEERQRILYLIRKGLVSDEEGEAQLVATAQERDALFARQATLEARINSQNGERAQLSAAEALLRELHDRAEGADNSVRRQVIETLVQQATVMVGEDRAVNLDVTYRFEEPGDIAYISSQGEQGGLRSR